MIIYMKRIIICIIGIALIIFSYIYYINTVNESIEALSKYGSSGEEVKQIQKKLKEWGYYNGNVDGVYGSKTQEAVKKFQRANKLTVDRNCRRKNAISNGHKFRKKAEYKL